MELFGVCRRIRGMTQINKTTKKKGVQNEHEVSKIIWWKREVFSY